MQEFKDLVLLEPALPGFTWITLTVLGLSKAIPSYAGDYGCSLWYPRGTVVLRIKLKSGTCCTCAFIWFYLLTSRHRFLLFFCPFGQCFGDFWGEGQCFLTRNFHFKLWKLFCLKSTSEAASILTASIPTLGFMENFIGQWNFWGEITTSLGTQTAPWTLKLHPGLSGPACGHSNATSAEEKKTSRLPGGLLWLRTSLPSITGQEE